jgi:dienelactone hydrolase
VRLQPTAAGNVCESLLALHGIAILLTTPTTTGDLQRAEDLAAAVEQIGKENAREGSPLKGKLATDHVCVTGHSMRGGGTLWAATELGSKIKCAVPLQPWQPGQSFDKIVLPTMFIAGKSDIEVHDRVLQGLSRRRYALSRCVECAGRHGAFQVRALEVNASR